MSKTIIMKLGEVRNKMTPGQLTKFRNLKDEDIDTSDIPEITKEWLDQAKIVKKRNKVSKTIRFDKNVIEFVQKKQGSGYQSLINNIITEWAKHHGMKV